MFEIMRKSTRHELVHSDNRPQYICNIYDKCYTEVRGLNRHMFTHTREKNRVIQHQCNVCDKELSDKYALKRHMSTHSDAKPYICQVCDAAFKSKSGLVKHLKRHAK